MEDLGDFNSAILLADFSGGESEELCEVNTSGLILVELGKNLIDELVLTSEAEVDEGLLKLSGVHNATSV